MTGSAFLNLSTVPSDTKSMSMTSTRLEPTAPSPAQVEELRGALGGLLEAREELRMGEADREALERNRQQIVKLQWELSRALIARHHRFQPA